MDRFRRLFGGMVPTEATDHVPAPADPILPSERNHAEDAAATPQLPRAASGQETWRVVLEELGDLTSDLDEVWWEFLDKLLDWQVEFWPDRARQAYGAAQQRADKALDTIDPTMSIAIKEMGEFLGEGRVLASQRSAGLAEDWNAFDRAAGDGVIVAVLLTDVARARLAGDTLDLDARARLLARWDVVTTLSDDEMFELMSSRRSTRVMRVSTSCASSAEFVGEPSR